jgi:hypothetical protein
MFAKGRRCTGSGRPELNGDRQTAGTFNGDPSTSMSSSCREESKRQGKSMEPTIAGVWRLTTWRRTEDDGAVVYPFGKAPQGLLIYTPDGYMAVQMVVAKRPLLDTNDALGGSVEERAAAYSSCLAYYGSYQVEGHRVIHRVEASLFPNWSKTTQDRPFVREGRELSLRVLGPEGQLTNEIVWEREDCHA